MSDTSSDCKEVISLLLQLLLRQNQPAAVPPVCGCPKEPGHENYTHALIRFNEQASQVAADKLQSAYDRQQERWHLTMRQLHDTVIDGTAPAKTA